MYKNEEKLNPPAYKPTETEIKLAKARYVMENYIWEMMHNLTMYYDMTKGEEPKSPYTRESVEESAKRSIEQWNKGMDEWEDDILDVFIDHEWFDKYITGGLSDMHAGDCTAIACSCMRCHSEAIFKIPFTATWGKHEGWKLFSEYRADVDKQEKESQKLKGE